MFTQDDIEAAVAEATLDMVSEADVEAATDGMYTQDEYDAASADAGEGEVIEEICTIVVDISGGSSNQPGYFLAAYGEHLIAENYCGVGFSGTSVPWRTADEKQRRHEIMVSVYKEGDQTVDWWD